MSAAADKNLMQKSKAPSKRALFTTLCTAARSPLLGSVRGTELLSWPTQYTVTSCQPLSSISLVRKQSRNAQDVLIFVKISTYPSSFIHRLIIDVDKFICSSTSLIHIGFEILQRRNHTQLLKFGNVCDLVICTTSPASHLGWSSSLTER